MPNNMNSLHIETDGPSEPMINYGVMSDDGNVEVVLRNLPRALIGSGISYRLLKNPVDLYRKTRTFVRLCRTSVRVFRLRRKTRSIFIGKLGRSL